MTDHDAGLTVEQVNTYVRYGEYPPGMENATFRRAIGDMAIRSREAVPEGWIDHEFTGETKGICIACGRTKAQHAISSWLIQLLTDPENQPHQYVGFPTRLAEILSSEFQVLLPAAPASPAQSEAVPSELAKLLDDLIAWVGAGQRMPAYRPIDMMPRSLEQRIYEMRQKAAAPASTEGKEGES